MFFIGLNARWPTGRCQAALERFAPARWSLATRGGANCPTQHPPRELFFSVSHENARCTGWGTNKGSLLCRSCPRDSKDPPATSVPNRLVMRGFFRGQLVGVQGLADEARGDSCHHVHMPNSIREDKPELATERFLVPGHDVQELVVPKGHRFGRGDRQTQAA